MLCVMLYCVFGFLFYLLVRVLKLLVLVCGRVFVVFRYKDRFELFSCVFVLNLYNVNSIIDLFEKEVIEWFCFERFF